MDKTISQHQKFPHPQIHHKTLQSTDSSRCSYCSTPLRPRITAQETAYSSSDGAPDNPPGIKKSLPLESKFFECRMLPQCNHCAAEVKNLITMRRSIRHLDACRLVETCSIRKVLFLLFPHEWKNAKEAGGEGSRGPRTENPQWGQSPHVGQTDGTREKPAPPPIISMNMTDTGLQGKEKGEKAMC